MSLDDLWQTYQAHGYAALRHLSLTEPLALFYLALLAFGHDDMVQACAYAAQAAAMDPSNLVFSAGAIYLARVVAAGKQHVYVQGDAFGAFIAGGGNVPLYAATSAALRQVYQQYPSLSLLDIGVGNGQALLPALTPNIKHLDILEPSTALLAEARTRLIDRGIAHTATACTLQAFVERDAAPWTISQATYSLQSIPSAERLHVLRWLRQHSERFVLVEFDVPAFAAMYSPERVRYVVGHYAQGLAEYGAAGSLVAQGFLMPVLFGYFDQTVTRTNYEQPIQAWVAEFQAAGFQSVMSHEIYPYWWASAWVVAAH